MASPAGSPLQNGVPGSHSSLCTTCNTDEEWVNVDDNGSPRLHARRFSPHHVFGLHLSGFMVKNLANTALVRALPLSSLIDTQYVISLLRQKNRAWLDVFAGAIGPAPGGEELPEGSTMPTLYELELRCKLVHIPVTYERIEETFRTIAYFSQMGLELAGFNPEAQVETPDEGVCFYHMDVLKEDALGDISSMRFDSSNLQEEDKTPHCQLDIAPFNTTHMKPTQVVARFEFM